MSTDAAKNDSNMADNVTIHCDPKIYVDPDTGVIPINVYGQHKTAPERGFP